MENKKTNKNVIDMGIIGSFETDTGQKTSTLVAQIESLEKMNVRAVYNEEIKEVELIIKKANLLDRFESIYNVKDLKKHKPSNIITDDLEVLLSIEKIDVVIVTEMNTEIATKVIYDCIIKGKNVVNMNAVSEVTLGPLFKHLACLNNVIYSVGAGDEPAATLDLITFCEELGLDVICAGKGKNNPLNIYCTPDDFIEKGKQINVSPRSIASFVDGTKTMLEMAILSNATGFPIDRTGMHGPKMDVSDLVKTFDLKKNGGILNRSPVVDYGIGDIAPGVFVVFSSKQKSIINELRYLKMGDGPNFVLYKPYHLGNIEAPLSIYDVVLKGKSTLTVKDKIVTAVVARVKKDLKKGDLIDSVGGNTFSGLAINYEEMKQRDYVPIGLVENSKVKKDIGKDKIITFKDIECNIDSIIFKLWNKQEKLL